ncbi:MAG: hypothetical protein ACT4OM_09415 [Actinomycetota bacterium]
MPAEPITPAMTHLLGALTRREFMSGITAAGLLAACGRGDDTCDQTPSTATRTVTHEFGTFEIPANPQRVVGTEGRPDLETAIALDLGIVGIGSIALGGGDQLAPAIIGVATTHRLPPLPPASPW